CGLPQQQASSFCEATSTPQNEPLDFELVVLESFTVGDPSLQIRAKLPKRLFGLSTIAAGDHATGRCHEHPRATDLPTAFFVFRPMGRKTKPHLLTQNASEYTLSANIQRAR